MSNKEKALKEILNGLTMLYIHIKAKPKKDYYVDILLSFNRALLQLDEINAATVKSLDTAIESISLYYYVPYKGWMSRYCQDLDSYNYSATLSHLDAFITVNRKIIEKLEKCEYVEAGIMASSVQNYPDFLLGRYEMLPMEFFETQICYYKTEFGGIFLDGYAPLFVS